LPPFHYNRHFFPLGWGGVVIGAWIALIGMGLIFVGWYHIHKSETLVTTVLYKYVRHSQYTGLSMIIIGWLLQWTLLMTLIMGLILLILYYWLAQQEEKELIQRYGNEYQDYIKTTPMFLPIKLRR
jgi:protein-S-isoprenylcysteine O-methyltransferase Ste14